MKTSHRLYRGRAAAFAGLWVALGLVGFVPVAQAGSLLGTGEGMIVDKEVSASVLFEVVDGNLQVTLTNTGERDDYSPAQVLADVSFSMASVDFDPAASSVVVGPNSLLATDGNPGQSNNSGRGRGRSGSSSEPTLLPAGTDLSAWWGLGRQVTLTSFDDQQVDTFDFSLTAASLDDFSDQTTVLFNGSTDSLKGGNYGIINAESRENSDALGNHPAVINEPGYFPSVVFTLVPTADTGSLTDDSLGLISKAWFSYGSAHEGIVGIPDDLGDAPNVIPLPSAAWAGVGLMGVLAVARWRRAAA